MVLHEANPGIEKKNKRVTSSGGFIQQRRRRESSLERVALEEFVRLAKVIQKITSIMTIRIDKHQCKIYESCA